MPHRFVTLLTLAAVSVTGLAALQSARRKRLAARSDAKPAAVQTWEGEGGGPPPAKARRAPEAADSGAEPH